MSNRARSNPQQPTDDVWPIFQHLIGLKRSGRHQEADEGYKRLSEKEINEPWNYPHVLKAWAKVKICLGEYEKAATMMDEASSLFRGIGNTTDAWQCSDQANTIKNRHKNRQEFIDYVRAASGGSVEYLKKLQFVRTMPTIKFIFSGVR